MTEALFEGPVETIPDFSAGDRQERHAVTLLSCVIRPESLDAVTGALDRLHVGGMTITDVRGFGRQRGQVEHYRGGEYTIRFLPKVKVEVAVQNDDAQRVLAALAQAAHTGQVGDGKAFVLEVRNAMRVRTGERGDRAL